MRLPEARIDKPKARAAQHGPAAKRPQNRIALNLLHNSLAKVYFSRSKARTYQAVKELFKMTSAFSIILEDLHKSNGIEDIDAGRDINLIPDKIKDFFIGKAAEYIFSFLEDVKYPQESNAEIADLKKLYTDKDHKQFILDFFGRLDGYTDLGKLIDAANFKMQVAERKGDHQAGIRHFMSIYFVLRAGHLLSDIAPTAAASISPPTNHAKIYQDTALNWMKYLKDGELSTSLKALIKGQTDPKLPPHPPDVERAIQESVEAAVNMKPEQVTAEVQTYMEKLKKSPNLKGIRDKKEFCDRGLGNVRLMMISWTNGMLAPDALRIKEYLSMTLIFLKYLSLQPPRS
jgi:hypothetical protein